MPSISEIPHCAPWLDELSVCTRPSHTELFYRGCRACMLHTFSLYDGIVPLRLEKLYDLLWLGAWVSTHLQADVDCSTGTVPLIHEQIYDLTWLDDLSAGTSPFSSSRCWLFHRAASSTLFTKQISWDIPIISEKTYALAWLIGLSAWVSVSTLFQADVDCSTELHPPHFYFLASWRCPFNTRKNLICHGWMTWAPAPLLIQMLTVLQCCILRIFYLL